MSLAPADPPAADPPVADPPAADPPVATGRTSPERPAVSPSPIQTRPPTAAANAAAEEPAGGFKRLVMKHGIWSVLSRGGGMALTALLAFLLARLLGTEGFGRLSAVRAAVELLAFPAAFGVDSAVLRFVGEARGAGRAAVPRGLVVRSAVLLGAASAAVAAAAGGAVLLYGERLVREPVGWPVAVAVFVAVGALAFTRTLGELARALDRPALANISGGERGGLIGPSLTAIGAVAVAAVTDADWVDVLAVMALSYAAAVAVLAFALRGVLFAPPEARAGEPHPVDDGPGYGELLLHCAPYFGYVLVKVAGELDVPLAAAFRPPEEVGLYAAARQLGLMVGAPLTVSNLIVVPFIARLHRAGEREKLSRLLGGAAAVAALPATAATLLVLAFTPTAVGLLFGSDFQAAVPLVRVLILGQLIFVWTGPCGFVLSLTGHNRALLTLIGTVTALQIPAALAVLPAHGVTGLAYVTAVACAAYNVGCWALARRLTGVWTHASFGGIRALLDAVRRRGAV